VNTISLKKVKNIADDERGLWMELEDGNELPISFYFIHASEVKFINRVTVGVKWRVIGQPMPLQSVGSAMM
jgi:hypothetical protein